MRSDPAQPGYRHIIFRPRPGGRLTWVKASYESGYGPISSAWQRTDGGLDWQVSVPPNTTAVAYVPAGAGEHVVMDGAAVEGTTFELGPGVYSFAVRAG